ncbi:ACT domain-containing protein [Pontiellaceae bacterium B12227]|nr:ACT domain-containing protein [Pontiellaceae bacterium B12227]
MADKQIMVISVMDRDRPGIVAEVTEGISALGGNLADLRESVLCGYFTMILVASFPQEISAETVERTMAEETASRVSVQLAEGSLTENSSSEDVYVLSAVGRDRVGLVALVSRFCCERGVNIIDLASHVDADQYTMMLQVDLSGIQSLEDFKAELSGFGNDSGLKLVLQHNDIFRATNEI